MCVGKPVDTPGRSPWELREVWRLAWEPLVSSSLGTLSSNLREPLHLLKRESWLYGFCSSPEWHFLWGLYMFCKHHNESESCSIVFNSMTPWTMQSMEFSRPEYWSGYPFPPPGDLPNPGIEPRSSSLQADSLPADPQGKPRNTGGGSLSLL